MAWNKNPIRACLIAYLSLSMAVASAASCDDLRNYFQKPNLENPETKERLVQLRDMVNSDDFCAKNLFGRLEYQGIFVQKDIENAKNIFTDLSNRDYPPAMFNLAYVQSQEKSSNPEITLGLLTGIYATNVDSKEYADLAKKSMEYGRSYIETLPEPPRTRLGQSFESALSAANVAAREKRVERIRKSDEVTMGFLGAVLGIGLGFMVGAKLAAGSGARAAATSVSTPSAPPVYTVIPSGYPGSYIVVPGR